MLLRRVYEHVRRKSNSFDDTLSQHRFELECTTIVNTICFDSHKKKVPVGARFFAHVQTGPGSHPASCIMGTGSFPGVKRPGRGADHPLPFSAGVKKG
jgi:hypothetical protein